MPQFARFIAAPPKTVLIGLAAVAAALVATVGWTYDSWRREADAKSRLSAVIDSFQIAAPGREGFERIIADAQKIRADHPRSSEARLAQYYIAVSEESLGNTKESVEHLQALIGQGDPVMKPLAQFALATIYANHGDETRAMEVYRQMEQDGALPAAASHGGGHDKAQRRSGGGPSF